MVYFITMYLPFWARSPLSGCILKICDFKQLVTAQLKVAFTRLQKLSYIVLQQHKLCVVFAPPVNIYLNTKWAMAEARRLILPMLFGLSCSINLQRKHNLGVIISNKNFKLTRKV